VGIARFLSALLPHLTDLQMVACSLSEQDMTVTVASRRGSALCPICHRWSHRVHARFTRTLADLPWGGHIVRIQLQGRRFRCDNRRCTRQTFRERLPQLALPYRRRTRALSEALEAIGFALGGQPGARLARLCHMPVSRMTLLRLVRAAPAPSVPPPRVLGVDDWAFRRGRLYGTILVDLERHCPVDLLPDRSAATLADWLHAHPGVEIASRDRGGAYADGIRQGAPNALQVADRWHLLHNLGDALEAFLVRERVWLPECPVERLLPTSPPAIDEEMGDPASRAWSAATAPAPSSAAAPSSAGTVRAQRARAAQRQECCARVCALLAQGQGIRQIARELGLARNTVRKYVRFPTARPPVPMQRPRRPRRLDPFLAYLHRRWSEGYHTSMQLFREIQARGYPGGASAVKVLAAKWRMNLPALPARPRPPLAPHALRWLLVKAPDAMTNDENHALARLFAAYPRVQAAHTLVQDFHRLLRERRPEALPQWLEATTASGIPELVSFVLGVHRDESAVRAALSLEWSQGQTEGQVNRLKTLKRQMYGRAAFPLLRQRLLHPA
jgi:transposase